MRNVRHSVAQAEEVLAHERFGEEIGDVLGCGHKWNAQPSVFHALADKVMPAIDMLRTRVVFRIV